MSSEERELSTSPGLSYIWVIFIAPSKKGKQAFSPQRLGRRYHLHEESEYEQASERIVYLIVLPGLVALRGREHHNEHAPYSKVQEQLLEPDCRSLARAALLLDERRVFRCDRLPRT